jgi:hypothetical protein
MPSAGSEKEPYRESLVLGRFVLAQGCRCGSASRSPGAPIAATVRLRLQLARLAVGPVALDAALLTPPGALSAQAAASAEDVLAVRVGAVNAQQGRGALLGAARPGRARYAYHRRQGRARGTWTPGMAT